MRRKRGSDKGWQSMSCRKRAQTYTKLSFKHSDKCIHTCKFCGVKKNVCESAMLKFKEKTLPCLIQTGESFSLNLHVALVATGVRNRGLGAVV